MVPEPVEGLGEEPFDKLRNHLGTRWIVGRPRVRATVAARPPEVSRLGPGGPRTSTTERAGGPRTSTTERAGGPRTSTTERAGGPRTSTTERAGGPSHLDHRAGQRAEVAPALRLHGVRVERRDGGSYASMAQEDAPVIPLLLDARSEHGITEATPVATC